MHSMNADQLPGDVWDVVGMSGSTADVWVAGLRSSGGWGPPC
jgi:hypothetical protein